MSPDPRFRLVRTLLNQLRLPEAKREADSLVAIAPRFTFWLVQTQLAIGDSSGAAAVVQRLQPDSIGREVLVALGDGGSWLLSASQRQLLFDLPLSAFSGDSAVRAETLANVARVSGDSARTRAYADTAGSVYERRLQQSPEDADLWLRLGAIDALRGHRAEAWGAVQQAVANLAHIRGLPEVALGGVYGLYLQVPDSAAKYFGLAIDRHRPGGWIGGLRFDPLLAAVRQTPRFRPYLQRLIAAAQPTK